MTSVFNMSLLKLRYAPEGPPQWMRAKGDKARMRAQRSRQIQLGQSSVRPDRLLRKFSWEEPG